MIFNRAKNISQRYSNHELDAEWVLVPSSNQDLQVVRQAALRVVRQHARRAAAMSLLPLPGADLVSDVSIFAQMMVQINHLFGLTPEQSAALHKHVLAYEATLGLGVGVVDKLLMQRVAARLQRTGGKILLAPYAAHLATRLLGRVASATLGLLLFRRMGRQHVEACARLAQELLTAQARK